MSKPTDLIADTTRTDAAIEAACDALAEGRPLDAMQAIGRAFEEHHDATRTDEASFRVVLERLARQAVRATFSKRARRVLH